ncbi:3-methyl-2-oxobutanoate hydroxymethyltransferase [Lipomyces arxii]|uniref:3-methyl-2-oxobutanoate hydroxymethyltransferase n=1 Tax=Lipomyces arxii TaxID=56418 RepID=UPI0034CE2EAC
MSTSSARLFIRSLNNQSLFLCSEAVIYECQRTMNGFLRTRLLVATQCCRQQAIRWSSHSTPDVGPSQRSKVTLHAIRNMYRKKIPISALTVHDFPSAMVADRAGVDLVLVGDSLAMVALGYESTNYLSMDEMLYHCRAVARGSKAPFIVADLPFGTYEVSPQQALASSIQLVRDGHAEAVKLEGGSEMAETVRAITVTGIPVLGHIGLTPQRSTSLGGFRVQGKTAAEAESLAQSARDLQDAGCFGVVLEAMPAEVADYVTNSITIPTIGIGAGSGCDGQILVQLDMLGNFDRFTPKFVKKYANNFSTNVDAIENYVNDVKSKDFPSLEHTYPMSDTELEKLKKLKRS